ncbi:MAG: hypothetical protein JEZ06_02435 [Anaerolineaceae bacterium]|nr:hypothetical protein [Anaerolineaceae bacterium]
MRRTSQFLIWVSFFCVLLFVLAFKAFQLDWFRPNYQLDLNGQPAILIFLIDQGRCECEQFVNDNARSQAENWSSKDHQGLLIYQIDIKKYSNLAKKYKIIRAPSMLLLNASGEIVWRQDGAINDDFPLDLSNVKKRITTLVEIEETREP